MKKKNIKTADDTPIFTHFNVTAVILVTIMLCGAAAGCITASYVGGDAGRTLTEFINGYLSAFQSDINVKEIIPDVLLELFKYPTVIFLLGYTAFGVVLIPVLVFMRGFFISFSVASVVRIFGYKGLLTAVSVYGMQAMVGIPCMLIISARAMHVSRGFAELVKSDRGRKSTSPVAKGYLAVFTVCAMVLLLCAVLEVFFVPKLTAWTSGFLI